MKYLIKFSYNGSKFNGFQRQKDCSSVQKVLEEALSIINKKDVEIKGAGRTDIGVHANGQCAHFVLDVDIPEDRLINAINSIVNPYIKILGCTKVNDDFHARFSVKYKKYVYKIKLGNIDPFLYDYYLFYQNNIDVKKLEECSKIFIGSHNFHNFVSVERENSNSIIYDIKIEKNNDEIDIIFIGKSFYRYMIRNLVGAMLDYNDGKCDILLIRRMIEEDNFNYQLRCAVASGLYLEEVYYE